MGVVVEGFLIQFQDSPAKTGVALNEERGYFADSPPACTQPAARRQLASEGL